MRQHSPRTTTSSNVEDGIQDFSPGVFSRSARCVFFRQIWRNYHPFGIIKISRVSLSGFSHSASLPDFSPFD